MMEQTGEAWRLSRNFIADPLVSALVFVYGAERFMRGLLEDLEAQTIASRTEIIVVDTGSPTDEGATVREFQARYDNIAYLRTETRETTTLACNRCIRAARGKYLTIANADDRHRRDAFERMVAELDAHPEVALVYGDSAVTVTENETLDAAHVVAHFRWPGFDPRVLFQVCHVGPQPMYRRALHERHGLYDESFITAADYEFWLRVVARGERFRHIPEVLGLYLKSPNSNEHVNLGLSQAESAKARVMHWPDAWGPLPIPGGNFLITPGNRPDPPPPLPPAPPELVATEPAGEISGTVSLPPLVSVIVPTYNRPDRLRRAIESVLNQTHENVEVIVVNDGGVDVEPVIASFAESGKIVYLRLGTNRERSAARNAGLTLARGRYVAYLDDDDWYEPEHLAGLVDILERSGAEVAYSDALRALEVRQGESYVIRAFDQPYSHPFDADLMMVTNYIPIPCVMHRRSCLDEVGLFDEQLETHEDWDLLIRLSRRYRFLHLPRATCVFTWRDDGTSTTSQRNGEFPGTTEEIHRRYAAEVARRPGVAQAQVSYLAGLKQRSQPKRFACSIIFPARGEAALARECLTRLGQVTRGIPFEVVVIDNGSGAETRAFLDTLVGDVKLIRNPDDPGTAAAWNQGARAASARRLVFLESGVAPREGWLRALVDEIDAHPEVHAAGAKLLDAHGRVRHAGLAFSRLTRRPGRLHAGAAASAPAVNRRRSLQAVGGGCLLVRRDAFEAVGGFVENETADFAVVELCLSIRERGGQVVYQPRAVLYSLADRRESDHRASPEAGGSRDAKPSIEHSGWGRRWIEDEDLAYLEDGLVCRSMRSLDGAAARLEQLEQIALQPDRAGWERVGEVQRRILSRGLEAAREIIAEQDGWPEDAPVLAWCARLAARLGLLEAAAGFAARARTMDDGPDTRAQVARVAIEQGRLDQAERELADLLASAPDHAEGWLMKGVLALQRLDHQTAMSAFEGAQGRGANPRKVRLGLGMAALGAGEAAYAWEIFSTLADQHPGDNEALHFLLRAGCALERWEDLTGPLERYLALKPGDVAVRFALAGVMVRLGRWSEARTAYGTLRRTAPALAGLDELGRQLEASGSAAPRIGAAVPD